MSSDVMSGRMTTAHSAVSKTSTQLSPKEKKLIIDGLIAILEEDKLKPWVDTGLKDEFERRYHTRLPADWLLIVKESGPDVIEVVTMSLTNVTKTLIQLPIRKSKTASHVAKPPQQTQHRTSSTANPKVREDMPRYMPKGVTQNRVKTAETRAEDLRVKTPEPRSPTPESKAAHLIHFSPERPNPNHKPQSISSMADQSPNPMINRSYSLLDDITPAVEQLTVSDANPNPVPNDGPNRALNTNGATNNEANGTGDEPKAVTNGQSVAKECTQELMNNTVEDVIFKGIPIPPPVLPPVKPVPINEEDFFDVVVLAAATPYNFIVVPFKNIGQSSEFFNLKARMLEMYDKEENHIELPPSLIQKGIFVAAKEKDMWYRVRVVSVLSENPFLVVGYLCDFGEHKTFELQNIQPLYNCFRGLPMQAIRASLRTVSPIGTDWDVITSVEFRKMVENKPFVCTVYAIREVDSEPVLSVSLCDTSGEDDVYVGSALVDKALARSAVNSGQ